MRVLVTGASGFIGRKLVAALLRKGTIGSGDGSVRAITELVLADLAAPAAVPAANGIAVRCEGGDLGDPAVLARLFAEPVDSLFHLAASLTTEAEADVARGLAVNVEGFLRLLEHCRRQAVAPRLVFASSIATFGGPLPATVDDSTPQTPQTSYGVHKVIAEQLINDHSRHGLVDGRALRLPIVVIRPKGAASVSDRIAAIVREPLNGEDSVCPLPPDTPIPVASVDCVVQSLLKMHDLPAAGFGHSRAFNLPALSVSGRQMAQALRRAETGRRLGSILWQEDAALRQIVESWPQHFDSARARQLGILPDPDFDSIIRSHLGSQT